MTEAALVAASDGPVTRVRVLAEQVPPPLVQIAHHTLTLGDRQAWPARTEEHADRASALGDTGTAAALLP